MTSVLIVLSSDFRRGAEVEGERLGPELIAAGFDVDVVALAGTAGRSDRLAVESLGRGARTPSTLVRLRRRAALHDIVLAYGSSTLPACAVALFGGRTPFIYRSIGDPAAWVRGPMHRRRTGLLMRRASVVVALWDGAADAIEELYAVPSDRTSVIPNARAREEFDPVERSHRQAARTDFGIRGGETVCGVVGSLVPEKRVELAIDAVAQLPGTRLLIVGDGPRRAELERRATEALGDRVTFTGALVDVRPAYAAMDVLLLPSSTEGMPGVVIEAALSGLPVVACGVGAVPWLFSNGVRGTLAPANPEAEEFAASIVQALPNSSDPNQLATTCSWPAVTARWSDVILEVVARQPRAARRHR